MKKFFRILKALWHLDEILVEYTALKREVPRLVKVLEDIEVMLTGAPDKQSAFARTREALHRMSDEAVHDQYTRHEKVKVIDQMVVSLRTRQGLISGTAAVGSRELAAKALAVNNIEEEINKLLDERKRYTVSDETVDVG